tara:strand:- start:207 stop:332 length:126 start_codon:yes stop_codon:yes gene_type:complete
MFDDTTSAPRLAARRPNMALDNAPDMVIFQLLLFQIETPVN